MPWNEIPYWMYISNVAGDGPPKDIMWSWPQDLLRHKNMASPGLSVGQESGFEIPLQRTGEWLWNTKPLRDKLSQINYPPPQLTAFNPDFTGTVIACFDELWGHQRMDGSLFWGQDILTGLLESKAERAGELIPAFSSQMWHKQIVCAAGWSWPWEWRLHAKKAVCYRDLSRFVCLQKTREEIVE